MDRRDKFFGYIKTLRNYFYTDKARHDFLDYLRAVIIILFTSAIIMIIFGWRN